MKDLHQLRAQLDIVDAQLLPLFETRMAIAREVGEYKKQNGGRVCDAVRETQLIAQRLNWLKDSTLRVYAESFFDMLLALSKQAQNTIVDRQRSKNIYLTGMPGSGKTTLAKHLVRMLDRKCVDTDTVVETMWGMSATEIFKKEGEEGFRYIETLALKAIAYGNDMVVSTGGGIVCNVYNIEIMKSSGIVIFIDTPLEIIKEQIDIPSHPLLMGGQTLESLYEQRIATYRQSADVVFAHTNCDIEQAVSILRKLLDDNLLKKG